jgi:hypothetical protein
MSTKQIEGERWLANRLSRFGPFAPVFNGTTTPETRKERFRELIRERQVEHVICGSKERKPFTYAQAFERLYGESL